MGDANNAGINKLGNVIQRRCRELSQPAPPLDFGTIGQDGALRLDHFPIPLTDFLVCRGLCFGVQGSVWARTAAADSHMHDVPVPEAARSLQPGDRVLAAWVYDDAVVVDIVRPAAGSGG